MKFIYFGTADVAKNTLELFAEAGYKPAAVAFGSAARVAS